MERGDFRIPEDKLPPITGGSEKQIKWANNIRLEACGALIGRMGLFYKAYTQGKVIEEQLVVVRQVIVDEFSSHDAKWWIDHRDDWQTMLDLDMFWRELILKAKARMEGSN